MTKRKALQVGDRVRVTWINKDDPAEAYNAAARFLGRFGVVASISSGVGPAVQGVGESPGDPVYVVAFRAHRGRPREIYWREELRPA